MCMKTFAFGSNALLFYVNATSIGTDSCSRLRSKSTLAFCAATVLSFCVKVTPIRSRYLQQISERRHLGCVLLYFHSMPCNSYLLEQIAAADMRSKTTFAFCAALLSFCVKATPTGAQEQILAADM
jgi:hypothetical protein